MAHVHVFPLRVLTSIRVPVAAFVLASTALVAAGAKTIATCRATVGDQWIHVVGSGETWTSIGARVGVEPAVLAARNDRTLRAPLRPGDVLGIDNRHIVPTYDGTGLVVNVPQRMLFHYREGAVRAHYPIGVGRSEWQTPLGSFTIVAAETDPTWDVPITIREEMRRAGKPVVKSVPPGPANPLGRYWLALSLDGVGIHGTNAPSSIYHFATHGCIRLHPEDIEDLFQDVTVGEHGRMVYEPVLVAFDGTDVFVEVHRDVYRHAPDAFGRAMELLERAGLLGRVDPAELARVVRDAEGLAVPMTRR
jgi:L,D-transpeptidase ErfK/SrfK